VAGHGCLALLLCRIDWVILCSGYVPFSCCPCCPHRCIPLPLAVCCRHCCGGATTGRGRPDSQQHNHHSARAHCSSPPGQGGACRCELPFLQVAEVWHLIMPISVQGTPSSQPAITCAYSAAHRWRAYLAAAGGMLQLACCRLRLCHSPITHHCRRAASAGGLCLSCPPACWLTCIA
jgi:hypothetical protein